MAKIEAVVFDVDGTIINTFEHIVQSFEVVLPQHGVTPDREQIRAVIGLTLIDCYKALAPDGDHEAMRALHHETQQTPEMYALITEYEGLREACDELARKGIKKAVQTNRSRTSIDLIFGHLGILDLFDLAITPDEVSSPKPDPEGIYLIAKEFHTAPDRMVIIGDTAIDVYTGKNAGMAATIAVTHGFGDRASLSDASYKIDSLLELPEVLESMLNK